MSQNTPADNQYTRGIASFVSGLRYEAIPDEVRTRIKLLVLDSLGCGIYGVTKQHSQILLDTLCSIDRAKTCGIWGSDRRLSAPHAALVNGTMVQGFELDDTHMYGTIHVGAVAVPPILAAAELRPGMSGKDFLTAAVAAYEIGPRVGICMGNEHLGQGWHAPATLGVFSAVAGAAAALKLSPEKAVHALGIAGTQSAGLMAAQYGSMVKRMNGGRAAQSGLYSALLADEGFTGIVNVFESEYGGFCTTFSRSQDRFKIAELTAGLGEKFETMRVSLKFYSCAGTSHTGLDAIRMMRERHPFTVDELNKIVVYGAQLTVDHVGFKYVPNGMTGAQMNLPFCIATLLLEGDVFVDQFTDAALLDPARIALADKVTVIHDPAITAKGPDFRPMVHVEIHLKDGTVLKETVEVARGRESRFASEAEVVAKFTKLADRVLPAHQCEQIVNAVLGVEKLDDTRTIAELLSRKQ
jgi:aconitate decarboxylase